MLKVERITFTYTNGDKKRKEFRNVHIQFDKNNAILLITEVPYEDKDTFYIFPLSTITNIKVVPAKKEEEE